MLVDVFGLERMKIVSLQGGLGNQMFQYAVIRALEIDKKKVYLDLSLLEKHNVSNSHFTAREYELNIFSNLRAKVLSRYNKEVFFSRALYFRIIRKLMGGNFQLIKQRGHGIEKIPKSDHLYLEGYFQSEKYFQSIRSNLINDFTFPQLDEINGNIQHRILKENSVSVHIRHGDYLKPEVQSTHGVLTIDYYKRAIDRLQKVLGDNVLSFYIFSDDIEYVKQNFSFLKNYYIVDINNGNNSWKDMCLMKSCKHHIVANSSFSWWGAWLSEQNGVTIAPSEWFNTNNVKFDILDFIPFDWHII